jgi:hypothetical protein
MRSLDDDLFELVFEQLHQSKAAALCRALLGHAVGFPTELDGVHEVSVESLALRAGIALGDVHVRLRRYDQDMYDVELNFRLRQANAPSNGALVSALYDFAAELAKAHNIATYFAGLEPVSDEDTRLFTGKTKGPYYHLS